MVGRGGTVRCVTPRGLANGGAGINFFVQIDDALAALKIESQGT